MKCIFCSAIDFHKDRVVDGDLNLVKDLLLSNYCEVSQNKDSTKMVSSMKDVDEKIVVTCEKEGKRDVSSHEEITTNSMWTNHLTEKFDLHDMGMEEHPPKVVSTHERTFKSLNPNHINTPKDSLKMKEINEFIEDHIFQRQMRTAILLGKFVSVNGLCHNDIDPCLRNFIYYTHHLMCKIDNVNCVKDHVNSSCDTDYDIEVQKQFLQDVDKVFPHCKPMNKKGLREHSNMQCILCSIVRSKKQKFEICNGCDALQNYSRLPHGQNKVGKHGVKNCKIQRTNCKCHNTIPLMTKKMQMKCTEYRDEINNVHDSKTWNSTVVSSVVTDVESISLDECTETSSMVLNDSTEILAISEDSVVRNPCQMDYEREFLAHQLSRNGGRNYRNKVSLIHLIFLFIHMLY